MKQIKNFLSLTLLFVFSFSFVKAQEALTFSDTTLLVDKFINHHGEWIILTKNKKAVYYDKTNKEITNLDGYKWKYTLSNSGFNGRVWFDNEHVYFGNTKNVERVSKKDGALVDVLPFENIESQPFFDGNNIHLIGDYKGKYSQICYNPKRKRVVWTQQTFRKFKTPIYSDRFIITRDSTGFPVTLSYDKGKPLLPEVYEGSCPFPSWTDMFNAHGNDPSDSIFYYNGYVYTVNFYFGLFSKYYPKNYPVPLVTVDMNKFTKKAPFSYSKHPMGSMFYTHQGIQFVTEQELDSLEKTKRKGAMGTYMPSIPISQPHYYKIKSTTKMGNFHDFGQSKFIAYLDNRYFVFEHNGQLIGVSPIGARTYNFPNLRYPIDEFCLHDNILFFSSSNVPYLFKAKVERIMTEEELKMLEPPKEFLEMLKQQQEQTPSPSGEKK